MIFIDMLELKQLDIVTQPINYDTQTFQTTINFHQHSILPQNSINQEDPNRVVKNSQDIQNQQTLKLKEKKVHKSCWKKHVWSDLEQLQYLYATIQFSINNPYFTISWQWWKPIRFYHYISKHLRTQFGSQMGRSVKQCKTKDQNFKVRQFNKSSDPIDLMEFSLKRLRQYIDQNETNQKQRQTLAPRIKRYKQILVKHQVFTLQMSLPKIYENQLMKLINYTRSVSESIKIVYKSSI